MPISPEFPVLSGFTYDLSYYIERNRFLAIDIRFISGNSLEKGVQELKLTARIVVKLILPKFPNLSGF